MAEVPSVFEAEPRTAPQLFNHVWQNHATMCRRGSVLMLSCRGKLRGNHINAEMAFKETLQSYNVLHGKYCMVLNDYRCVVDPA